MQAIIPSLRSYFLFHRATVCVALAAGFFSWSSAQVAPNPPTVQAAKTDEVVTLTPFQVNTGRDVGFVASSALAGGRLATDLSDTPVAYSVLTREFIDALNLTDLTEATKWTVNTNQTLDNGSNIMFGNDLPNSATIRGITSNQPQIDFFPVYFDYDSFNLERFDYARGPNAVLFGNGSLGGTPNANLKQARGDRPFRELRLTVGSWSNYRGTFDVNQPVGKKIALRANGLWQDSETWRDREFNRRKAGSLALSYKPWPGAELRGTGDLGRFERNVALSIIADGLSGWDGVTTFASPLVTLPANANAVGIARRGATATPYYVYSAGLGGAVYNLANTAVTVGGNANAAVPIGGALVAGTSGNYSGQPVLEALNRPGNAFGLASRGASFRVPARSETATWDSRTFRQKYEVFNLAFTQQFGGHYFFEAAANHADFEKNTDYGPTRGLSTVQIDLNRNLPSGVTNPEFLQPYHEITLNPYTLESSSRNYRAGLAAVYERTRLGDFRLNLLAGRNQRTVQNIQYITALANDPDPRNWTSNPVRLRHYLDQKSRPLVEPGSFQVLDAINGNTTAPVRNVLSLANLNFAGTTREQFTYTQAAGNAKLFKGRLSLLGAVRRDDYSSRSRQSVARGDYPAGWDGYAKIYRPDAPANYKSLTYVPKNAAGQATGPAAAAETRPRDAAGRRLAQYANDAFQDDFSAPFTEGGVTTYSIGGVLHATKWVSLIANYAETYNLRFGRVRIDGSDFSPFLSKGKDAGLRFTLFDGRLVATATAYRGEEINVGVVPGPTAGLQVDVTGAINSIANANVIGDFSTDGRNTRGLNNTPINYGDLATRQASGYELDLTANLTKEWRLLANIALPKATLSGAYPDTRAFLAKNDAVLRQILADTGALVGSNGVAGVNPAIPVNQRSPDLDAAISAWNGLQSTLANLVTGAQKVPRLSDVTANLFTDYTLGTGRLKGLRFGGGVNYRSKQVIGFRGGDTIRDPANPAQATDDPAVDGYAPVYSGAHSTVTAVLGYTWRLANGRAIRFDLTVNNALNNAEPQYYNTVLRPPGGDLANPARVATPNNYGYVTPRAYALSTTMKF